jgi:hypothetical protein
VKRAVDGHDPERLRSEPNGGSGWIEPPVAGQVLAGKTRRALDSTVLDDAVARQDTDLFPTSR